MRTTTVNTTHSTTARARQAMAAHDAIPQLDLAALSIETQPLSLSENSTVNSLEPHAEHIPFSPPSTVSSTTEETDSDTHSSDHSSPISSPELEDSRITYDLAQQNFEIALSNCRLKFNDYSRARELVHQYYAPLLLTREYRDPVLKNALTMRLQEKKIVSNELRHSRQRLLMFSNHYNTQHHSHYGTNIPKAQQRSVAELMPPKAIKR